MQRAIVFILAWWCPAMFVSERAWSDQWSRFRGPNGKGVADVVEIPAQWQPRHIRWQAELPGVGHSSPVICGRRLFLTSGMDETGERVVLALDALEGQPLWERRFAAATHRKHSLNSFASPTPAVDKDGVYVSWGTTEAVTIIKLTHTGELVWRKELGPFKGGHGFGVSPMLIDNLVVMPLEQQGPSQLVALDQQTGEVRWNIDRESNVHYATPCIYRPAPDQPAQLIFTNWEQGIVGVDAATGKVRWQADVFDKSHVECSIGSPVIAGDLVIGTCGWLGHGNEVIAVKPDGNQAEMVYRIDRGAPLCTTPLVCEDLLVLWADNGVVSCHDVHTGELHWRKRVGGTFYASPICVSRRIYNIDADGEVTVLAAARDYEVLARNSLGQPSHSTPAVAHGMLYLRTFSKILALGPPKGTDQ